MESSFEGVTPKRADVKTPNMMLGTPFRTPQSDGQGIVNAAGNLLSSLTVVLDIKPFYYLFNFGFYNFQVLTPRMGGTPGPRGTMTPGRGSVRDKLSINREDALSDEYEMMHMGKQQQVSVSELYLTIITINFTCSF